jgi:hypothetical protein
MRSLLAASKSDWQLAESEVRNSEMATFDAISH